jgi:hypothetical protein
MFWVGIYLVKGQTRERRFHRRSSRCAAQPQAAGWKPASRMQSCPTRAHAVSTSIRKCPVTSGGQKDSSRRLFVEMPVQGKRRDE